MQAAPVVVVVAVSLAPHPEHSLYLLPEAVTVANLSIIHSPEPFVLWYVEVIRLSSSVVDVKLGLSFKTQ